MKKNDFTEYIEEANIVFLNEVNKCYVLHTIKKMNEYDGERIKKT